MNEIPENKTPKIMAELKIKLNRLVGSLAVTILLLIALIVVDKI